MNETSTEIANGGFNPFSAAFSANPYPTYAALRARNEPVWFEPMNCFLLSRYEDVELTARNPRMVRSLAAVMPADVVREAQRQANFHNMPNHERFVQFSLLETDGDVHRKLRMVLLRAFSKSFIEQHRQMITGHVNALLDTLLPQGEIEFVSDLAAKLPGNIIGRILGVPEQDCDQLRIWSDEIVQYFDADRTEENKQRAESATTAFYEYLTAQIASRQAADSSGQDLLTTLVLARDKGELTETELMSTAMLILAGGNGSTIDVLGTGMLALLQHPAQLALLRADPTLIPGAVQEMFRFDSPLPFFHRYASEPLTVMSKTYPKGTKFGLLYGAANRDPDAFEQPDAFDVKRTPNRHVAFGRGAHLCLGNNLARLNMTVLFEQLLLRTRSIRLVTPTARYRPGLSSRGLVSLDLALDAA